MKKLMLNSKMIHSRDRLFNFIFIPYQSFIYKKIKKQNQAKKHLIDLHRLKFFF
jgi:hypothetical protein